MSQIELKMAIEAQKLIAVSLGKIQASRGQRGGPSLFRSLLVSTVLHKARTTYMENFHAIMLARRVQQEELQKEKEESPKQTSEHEAPSPAGNPDPPKRARLETDNKENTPPPASQNVLPEQDTEVKPKPVISEKNQNVSEDTVITKDCAKCVKRRLTDVQENTECTTPKRAKQQCENNNENVKNEKIESNSEPMQTDSQISSLVQRFNSGLSNFLGSSTGHVNAKVSTHAELDSLNGQGQGLTSCSTQVMIKPKESFADQLSRPGIALSV